MKRYVIRNVVFDAEYVLVDGVEAIGKLLHKDGVFSDILKNGIGSLLEDVDDISRLYLGLSLAFLLLRTAHQVHLGGCRDTLGLRLLRRSEEIRIIVIYNNIQLIRVGITHTSSFISLLLLLLLVYLL